MNSLKKAGDDQKDEAAQLELQRLERQFRAMKNDEEACPKDLRITLTKQKKLIKILEDEKNQLLKDISMKANVDEDENDEIAFLINEYNQLTDKIAVKSEILKDLNSQIQDVKSKVEKSEMQLAPYMRTTEVLKKEERLNENLEMRLCFENVKCNEETWKTSKMRKEIELLLHQRNGFKKQFHVLSSELALGKKILCDLIEQGTDAYNQRKDAEVKLAALKVKARSDLIQNCSEAEVLQRRLEYGEVLNEFIAIKAQRRINEDFEKEKNTKKEEETKKLEEHLLKYNGLLNDIKELFNETDLNLLVMNFMKVEENNYNIYTFNNELNKKLNALRKEMGDLHDKIYQKQNENKSNLVEYSQQIDDLKEQLMTKRSQVKSAREKLATSNQNVAIILEEIQELFNLFSCDYAPIRQRLGENSKTTKENVMSFLQALEERFQSISANAYYHLQHTTPVKGKGSKTGIIKAIQQPVLPSQPCALCAEVKDISDADESIALPLDTEDARLNMREEVKKGGRADLMHSVAECRMPKARKIMQNRLN